LQKMSRCHIALIVSYFWCCFFSGLTAGDSITSVNNQVIGTEGEYVTLNCTYETSSDYPWLYWYRQYPNQAPQFILYKGANGETDGEFKNRFHAHLNVTTKSVPLTIQGLQLSDSAVYYCALRPTVTTGYTAVIQKLCVHVF
uniref:Ig-like domain-containing protein n=1 Tax=Esox lucius TaxID=8010 RepID=A0A6Q2YXW0_ESOLU